MDYPDFLIRGMSDGNMITEEGMVALPFFDFKPNEGRCDEMYELSINWLDCEDAKNNILEKKRDGERYQFKVGYVQMTLSAIDKLREEQIGVISELSYERQAIADNIYHGNLLCKAKMSKQQLRLLQAAIALNAGCRIVKRESLE